MHYELIPTSAPFDDTQRAWLNGFLSGFLGLVNGNGSSTNGNGNAMAVAANAMTAMNGTAVAELEPPAIGDQAESVEEDFPWKDDSLPILDRVALSEGRPLNRRLMSAMAQLDCGTCGYVCQTYSEAIANGEEKNLKLCSPGGKDTAKMIKQLLKDAEVSAPANGSVNRISNGAQLNGTTINGTASNGAATNGTAVLEAKSPADTAAAISRNNPYPASIIQSTKLSKPESDKHISHVEIDLNGSQLQYKVGDALGVFPTNCPELVSQIVEALDFSPEQMVSTSAGEKSLTQALEVDFDLAAVSDELLELIAVGANDDLKQQLSVLEQNDELDDLDVLDLLQLATPSGINAQEFIDTLTPMAPRLYSIASSLRKHPGQVHLTVGRVETERNNRKRKGVASTMFSDRLQPTDRVRVFVQPSHGFSLPEAPATPIIMVGPGTGVAPFRAFLQDRACETNCGESWLFFGDQRRAADFIYEEELVDLISSNVLTRLDLAFSRDQEQKIYVQDRMREQAQEIYDWLQRGAHFYVCGDAKRMAADVDRALHDIIAQQGNLDADSAKQYVKALKDAGRYQRDVY